MKNINPNAIVRLGDLMKPPFKQLPDGMITIDFGTIPPEQLDESVKAVLSNITVTYADDATDPVNLGTQVWTLNYTDDTQAPPAAATAVLWAIPVKHQYDTTGEYAGSMLDCGKPDLT